MSHAKRILRKNSVHIRLKYNKIPVKHNFWSLPFWETNIVSK